MPDPSNAWALESKMVNICAAASELYKLASEGLKHVREMHPELQSGDWVHWGESHYGSPPAKMINKRRRKPAGTKPRK